MSNATWRPLDGPGVPTLGVRERGPDRCPPDRRRPPRPPSRPLARTGGAAGAVIVMMVGAGTLGAVPAVQGNGRSADTAVVSAVPVAALSLLPARPLFPVQPLPPVLDPDVGALLGRVGTATAPALATATAVAPVPAVPAAPSAAALPADGRTSLQQIPAQFTTALPDQLTQVAIRTAVAQIGLPYQWGGDGPSNGDAGFDCSGLTTFAYAAAGVGLPRTAHTQYYMGPHVPVGAALAPGDLVFYGTPAYVHHVGVYLGGGTMVNAPTFGQPVQVAYYRWSGDDYLGATRPAALGVTSTGLLPYAPAAPSTGAPRPFPAPTAPAPTAVPTATAPQPSEAVSAAEAKARAARAGRTAPRSSTAVATTTVSVPPRSSRATSTAKDSTRRTTTKVTSSGRSTTAGTSAPPSPDG